MCETRCVREGKCDFGEYSKYKCDFTAKPKYKCDFTENPKYKCDFSEKPKYNLACALMLIAAALHHNGANDRR